MFQWSTGILLCALFIKMKAHTPALVGEHSHECSCHIAVEEHSRVLKASGARLDLMVTHPSTNQAHGCLSLVIEHDILPLGNEAYSSIIHVCGSYICQLIGSLKAQMVSQAPSRGNLKSARWEIECGGTNFWVQF